MNRIALFIAACITLGCQNTPIDDNNNNNNSINAFDLIRYKRDNSDITMHFPTGIGLAELFSAIENYTNCTFTYDSSVANKAIYIVRNSAIKSSDFSLFLNSILDTHHLALYPISRQSKECVMFKVVSIHEMYSLCHPIYRECDLNTLNDYQWGTCTFDLKHITSNNILGLISNIASTPKSVLTMTFRYRITVTDNVMHLKYISKLIKELDLEKE